MAEQTGIGKEALRNWVRQAEDADLPVEPLDSAARIRQLEGEVRELRRSNEILKSATGTRPPTASRAPAVPGDTSR